MKTFLYPLLLPLLSCLLFIGCGEKSSDSVTLPLSDADVERLLKEAVERDSLQERNGLYYQTNESEPFSGWAKTMSDSEYGKVTPAHRVILGLSSRILFLAMKR